MARKALPDEERPKRARWLQATHPTARALRWLGMIPFLPSAILLFALLLVYWPHIERGQDLKAWLAATLAVVVVSGLLLGAGSVVERLAGRGWPRFGTQLLNILGFCAIGAGSVLLAVALGAALFATFGETGASLAWRSFWGALGFLSGGAAALMARGFLLRMPGGEFQNADVAVGIGVLAVLVPIGNPWLLGVG